MNQLKLRPKRSIYLYLILPACIVALGIAGFLFYYNKPTANTTRTHIDAKPHKHETVDKFDKKTHSIDTPGSLWWIVGKKRPLPEGYTPPDLVTPKVTTNSKKSLAENTLRSEPAAALEKLFTGAKQAGFDLMLASGYRSTELQATYYNNYVATSGQAEADRYSAKPGTSEHQTGLSLDVARADRSLYLTTAFGEDPSGRWLAEHVHEYGFVIRYPKDKESITGYMYEPWHIRYVGSELANELHNKQQTMEEFFGI